MKISGIYEITNTINGKKYIGKSENCYGRWLSHKSDYILGNNPLYNDMREYGIENFTFRILQKIPAYLLKNKQLEYIEKFHTKYPLGYNTE